MSIFNTETQVKKTILDLISRIDSLALTNHSHVNIATLDAISSAFLTADREKLDLIEENATAAGAIGDAHAITDHAPSNATPDMSGATIKSLYESQPETNALTDQYKNKLDSMLAITEFEIAYNITSESIDFNFL